MNLSILKMKDSADVIVYLSHDILFMPLSFSKKTLITLFLILTATLLFGNSYAQSTNSEKKHVLVLNAYHENYHWTERIMDGIYSVFESDDNTELFIEYMDTKRCSDQAYYEKLKETYRYKYRNIHIETILATDDNALNFLLSYRDEIFPETPVSFCGIVDFSEDRIKGHQLYTGVYETFDTPGNVELILRNNPETRRIVTVSDSSSSGIALLSRMKQAENAFHDQIDFSYLVDHTQESLKSELRKLAHDTAVIWAIQLKYPDGKLMTSQESIKLIESYAKRPIYCIWDVVGKGALGGKLTNPVDQGREAAKIAKQILSGVEPSTIPVVGTPAVFKFDYDVLKKYGISEKELPAGSVVINHPFSFFEEYRNLVIAVCLIIFLLTLLSLVLVRLYRNSKRTEKLLKSVNNDLKQAKDKAEESDRLKTAFLTNLSHEIRTPMNGIMGFLDCLKDKDLPASERSSIIETIENSGDRMVLLIDDLLNISKIESGIETLNETEFCLNKTLKEVHTFFSPKAKGKGLKLIQNTSETDETFLIKTDKIKLEQVIYNLLKNAINFTDEGIVSLFYQTLNNEILFTIADTGIGISKDSQEVIFLRFRKANEQSPNTKEGLGLGLSISKAFVELMDGKIWLDSSSPKGSVFMFKIPLQKVELKPDYQN